MRSLIILISFLAISLLFFPECACSQNADAALPEFNSSAPVPSAKTSKDPFKLATDEQIEEAQHYYESCKANSTLSSQKDCKCAAAAFLETRIKLGDAASVDEIMQENINTCLLDENKKISDVDELNLDEVTEQQMEEAEEVYASCKESLRVSRAVDCDCLAAKFLDERIKRGPLESQNIIVLEITQRECRNVVETTGMEFESCMRGTSFNYNGIRPKDYCECYAKMWGKLFESFEGKLDERKKSNLRLQARAICQKPETYRKK